MEMSTKEKLTAALVVEMNGFIDASKVSAVTNLSTTEIHRLRTDNRFPEPETIKGMRKGWRALEIMSWIDLRENWNAEARKKWMANYQKDRGVLITV